MLGLVLDWEEGLAAATELDEEDPAVMDVAVLEGASLPLISSYFSSSFFLSPPLIYEGRIAEVEITGLFFDPSGRPFLIFVS